MKKTNFFSKQKVLIVLICFFGTSLAYSQYCIPACNCEDDDLILNVEFAGINNPSDCSPSGYGDYTEEVEPAQVDAGETYTFSALVGAGWEFETVVVWIDFDQNETFDNTEVFVIGTGSGNVVSADITIPNELEDGIYRMRVNVMANDIPFDDPCYFGFSFFGEFEDYLINVGTTMGATDFVNSNDIIIYTSNTNYVIESKDSPINTIEVFDLTGRLILHKTQLNTYTTSLNSDLIKNQLVIFRVKTVDGNSITKKLIF
ncbi:MAG: GEVED domain-containing protein [Moheibacter sp.]